jgi:hypothetical protein
MILRRRGASKLAIVETTCGRLRDVPIDGLLRAQLAMWRIPGFRPLNVRFAPRSGIVVADRRG